MKAVLEHLPPDADESFFAKSFTLPYFGTPWHYHPEFEIVLVIQSHGKRFIGNNVSDFKEGNLSFLGSNLPHLYRNPPEYYQGNENYEAKSIVIHFLEESLGRNFLLLPQLKKITELFERSKRGIDIIGKTKADIINRMHVLLSKKGLQRLICLLEILDILADTTDYALISDPGITGHNALDAERLNKVFEYVLVNFNADIKLKDVSDLLHMTRTSFCRFFLERTKRTFSTFVIDVRLNHAAKLLIETDSSISEIAYESGYGNFSNFNRQFRGKFSVSPSVYRKTYLVNY